MTDTVLDCLPLATINSSISSWIYQIYGQKAAVLATTFQPLTARIRRR
jgi:hypothetical protein